MSPNCTPLRWPAGPLDLKRSPESAAEKDANAAWLDPKALAFLEGGPVNAILVTWAAGTATDAEQQAGLQPIINEARTRNIAVIGRITGRPVEAACSARQAGLSGIVVDGEVDPAIDGLQVIPAVAPQQASTTNSSIIVLRKNTWPRVAPPSPASGVVKRPGSPRVDSNGWSCSLAQAKAPGKRIWVMAEPPQDVSGAGSYTLAVADCAVYGGTWVIAFDAGTRKALASGGAKATWQSVTEAVSFFEVRRPLLQQPDVAKLGILSSFEGPDEIIAEDVLNLMPQRGLPYRILDLRKLRADFVNGLQAVLWLGEKAPSGSAKTILDSFVAEGGTLIVPASVSALVSGKPVTNFENRFDIYSVGNGRIAVASRPWGDPWLLSADVHLVLGRKHDIVRLFNAMSCRVRFTSDGKQGYAHVLNYTARPLGHPASVYVAQPFQSARWSTWSGIVNQPTDIQSKGAGVQVDVPDFAPYALIELDA